MTRYVTSYRDEGTHGQSCRACHRIAERETRSSWISDAIGDAPPPAQQTLPWDASHDAKSFLRWMSEDLAPIDKPIRACVEGGDLPGGSPVTHNYCVWARP